MEDPKLGEAIAEANMAEDRGDHGRAQAGYLKAVKLAGDDHFVVGQLYINLGSNAADSGHDRDAVAFYLKAIKLLEGMRGDGLVQCAYAHWNLARALLRTGSPDAVQHARRAKELFDSYPFASPTDVADAYVVYVGALVQNGHTTTEALFRDTWKAVLSAPSQDLSARWVEFVVNHLAVARQVHPTQYDAGVRELRRWAPPEVVEDILELLEDPRG